MIGKTLRHRYHVESLLGEGSTAAVYLARDERLSRVVALKMLLPHVNEAARRRFFQEAQAVAQLNHPGIMGIYDMDEEDGKAFLIVEYVEGKQLSEFIPSPAERVIELGRQIAEALQYAHDRQIIHRDIKPANIMVTPAGQVKIMDLGLALPREAKRVTAAGMIIGTPAYLSPEQAQGLSLDYRTDIYSLGIVLYELATGQLPFATDDIPALLLQHVKQPPPPLRQHVPDLPQALENVILRALEKNPSRRFQSGEALARALVASHGPDSSGDQPTRPSNSVSADKAAAEVSRVYVADDHTVLRRSLVSFISQYDRYVVIGEAGDGESALRDVLNLRPDVVLLDLNMPVKGGLDILPSIRAEAPDVRVLVLTGRDEEWYIMRALRAGAHGYLLKSSSEDELIDAIDKVSGGQLVLGRGVAEKVVTGMLRSPDDSQVKLNDLERQVMLLVATGYENDVIAERLEMSLTDLIEVLASAMDKMNAKDRHAAALQAVRRGEILLEELHGP